MTALWKERIYDRLLEGIRVDLDALFSRAEGQRIQIHICAGKGSNFLRASFPNIWISIRHLQPNITNCISFELGFRLVPSLSCMQSVTFSTGTTKIFHQIQVSFDDFQKVQQNSSQTCPSCCTTFDAISTFTSSPVAVAWFSNTAKFLVWAFCFQLSSFFHEMRWGCHWNRQLSFPFLVVSDLLYWAVEIYQQDMPSGK